MRTRVSDLSGTRLAIVQGGMRWVGRAGLAAVSNAGGLGTLSALAPPTPEALGEEIARCRALTSQPFGANVTMLRTTSLPPCERIFPAWVDDGVPLPRSRSPLPAPAPACGGDGHAQSLSSSL